jgi:hypothetical protein
MSTATATDPFAANLAKSKATKALKAKNYTPVLKYLKAGTKLNILGIKEANLPQVDGTTKGVYEVAFETSDKPTKETGTFSFPKGSSARDEQFQAAMNVIKEHGPLVGYTLIGSSNNVTFEKA